MATHLIDEIDYPGTIEGTAGETITITVYTSTTGAGATKLYFELYAEGQLLGEGQTDQEIPPGEQLEWTLELTVNQEIPAGTELHFAFASGHLDGSAKTEDDRQDFVITVEGGGGIPDWAKIAIPVALIGLMGVVYVQQNK